MDEPVPSRSARPESGGQAGSRDPLAERLVWLIRLRWIAVVGIVAASWAAATLDWVLDARPLFVVAGFLALTNFLFRRTPALLEGETGDRVEQSVALQIFCDLSALTMLLHWSGGMENPFAMFFAFHMAIGAIILRRRSAYLLGIAAFVLFGGTILGEAFGVLSHHPLLIAQPLGVRTDVGLFWHARLMVAGYLLAFGLMLAGVIFFVQTVERQRLRAERRARIRERVADSRERMARMGQISAGVAHTVRNPLHGLMNCVEILRGEAGPGQQETLDMMAEGLSRIEGVTRRLLTLTAGTSLRPRPTDLPSLIRESLAFVDPRLRKGKVELQMQLQETPPIHVDPDRLGECLINLLDNAYFACRDNGRVEVRTALLPDDSRRVVVEIRDTGEGIPAADLRRIFDPFFTTKAIGVGSGLGLPIARSVVEQHGGELTVESRPGSGTAFQIVLPIAGPGAEVVSVS